MDLDGALRPADEVDAARDEQAFFRGAGLYETILAVDGRFPFGESHLARLRASAQSLPDLHALPDDATVLDRARAVLSACGLDRGPARVMLRLDRSHLLVIASAVPPDLERARRQGVRAITVGTEAPATATHKWVARPELRAAAARAREAGAGEALVVGPGGALREGATSSVFCVIGDRLVTPPLEAGILPGVTRSRVLALARESGPAPAERPVPIAELLAADEVFLTSAIRLLVPVIGIDAVRIGSGRPGPVSRRLLAALCAAAG